MCCLGRYCSGTTEYRPVCRVQGCLFGGRVLRGRFRRRNVCRRNANSTRLGSSSSRRSIQHALGRQHRRVLLAVGVLALTRIKYLGASRCPSGLTPPSSGRLKGRFAPFAPPLMSNVRSRQTRLPRSAADPSFVSVPASGAVGTNASKRPYHSQGNWACRLAVALASSPGPPVRWRSAHCRCSGRHLSSHGRPEAPSVSAGNCMESSRAIGRIGLRFAWPSREVVRPELSGAHCLACVCSTAALQLAPVLRHLTPPSSGRA